VKTVEHRVFKPDSELGWQQWTNRAIFDEKGRLVEYQAVGRDITERKQAEERFRATFEQAAVGFAQVSVDGRMLMVNEKLCKILGYAREELLPSMCRTFRTRRTTTLILCRPAGCWLARSMPIP
jgi:PAS domain-containing protein